MEKDDILNTSYDDNSLNRIPCIATPNGTIVNLMSISHIEIGSTEVVLKLSNGINHVIISKDEYNNKVKKYLNIINQ